MIISHKHKFIFIKTAKTAGTSIEVALANLCGDDDVITPLSGDQEAKRQGRGAQNLHLDHPAKPKVPLYRRLLGRPERPWHPSVGYYSHMPAWRVRTYVGEAIWNDYFVFAFDRNPWDRQISHYHYKIKNKVKPLDFETYMQSKRRAFVNNFELYSEKDKIIVDYVGCFENINEEFEKIQNIIGIKDKVSLPVKNKSKQKVDNYKDLYSEKTKEKVSRWYRNEIDVFNYQFEQDSPPTSYQSS